jgi:hypothetical protein
MDTKQGALKLGKERKLSQSLSERYGEFKKQNTQYKNMLEDQNSGKSKSL